MLRVVMLSVIMLAVDMLSVVMLAVDMLRVVMLNVVKMNVAAPPQLALDLQTNVCFNPNFLSAKSAWMTIIFYLPGACTIKLFMDVIYGFCNKPEFLSLASLSKTSLMFVGRPGDYPIVEHLKSASLGSALALPANIRLGCKGLSETNTLAYYRSTLITVEKKFF